MCAPTFVSRRDFQLQPTSPAIDARHSVRAQSAASDFAGNPRVVDGNALLDIGAFEFIP
jgi:hypothetical protein